MVTPMVTIMKVAAVKNKCRNNSDNKRLLYNNHKKIIYGIHFMSSIVKYAYTHVTIYTHKNIYTHIIIYANKNIHI